MAKFRTSKVQALLIYLAVEREQAHRRDFLMELLWPGLPQPSAQANLRQSLYQLNRATGEVTTRTGEGTVPLLLSDRQAVQINPDAAYELDVATFTGLLKGEPTPEQLKQAVALYRGDFLADFYLPDSSVFEEWAAAWRARLRRQALEALDNLATHAIQQGDYNGAAAYARRQLDIDNLRESATRRLMLALARSGQRSQALAQYDSCRRLLRDELGVEPSPPTRALYERLARGEGVEVAAAPGAAGPIGTSERPRHNLPLQLSSFIGREQELAEVGRLLATSRLVTLTGAGGSGKTRLALQAAAGVLDTFVDGVWFVELAPLSDATLVPQAAATALDVREVGDRPLLTLLLNYLRNRQLLLVLDNCEHLVAAAAQLAEALLSHCPQLQVLATSREALNITGEAVWPVPPLSLPEPGEQPPLDALRQASLDTFGQADAIRLFVERATAVLPTFVLTENNATAVEQVCRRLDGIPLAIELAAARVKLLRVEQIAARLDDRFQLLAGGSRTALPRHQTLQALIDWSYDLLTPAEQRLLCRLSVFAGGFTLEAAEAICADKESAATDDNLHPSAFIPHPSSLILHPSEVLELLAQLVNKSLVVMKREPGQDARYHLLETIRQYALEKLEAAGEAGSARDRHLDFFLHLAQTAEPKFQCAEQLLWLDRLEQEHDNLRAALAWSLANQNGNLESGLRLATALVGFWTRRSHLQEGVRWLDVALAKGHSAAPTVQARLLLNAGWLRVEQRESDPTALLQESLALYRQLDDKKGIAWTLCWLGFCALVFSRETAAATSLFSESLTLAGEVDDKPLMTWIYPGLAWLAMEKNDDGQVTELAARGLALAREMGDQRVKHHLLNIQGISATRQRDYARATAVLQEALALTRKLKNRRREGRILTSLGEVARVQQAYDQAAVFYHESLTLNREVDNRIDIAVDLNNLGLVALGQDDRPQATSLFRESMALAQELKDKSTSWWNVWGLARVALAEGQTRRAVQLFAAVRRSREIESLDPVDQDDTERDVALARAQLGEEAFAAAWAEGQAMSLEEAVVCALE